MPPACTIIMTNREGAGQEELLPRVRKTVEDHGRLVGILEGGDAIPSETERIVVIGGDGTILSTIRANLDREVPVLGVNAGRLGVLAEFDADSLERNAAEVFGPAPLIRRYLALRVSVIDHEGRERFSAVAINDCVVTAGAPFRMIELSLRIDDTVGPSINGDGLIVASPIGSTAYNVSAGGPIVQPTVDAMVISAVAPHSLAFRPIVADGGTTLEVGLRRSNEGTTLVLDGQVTHGLEKGDRLVFRKHDAHARLVGNPDSPYWNNLIEKMRWGAPPTYRNQGT